jgi:asparagine synthase (glutamine-hydrolysing)
MVKNKDVFEVALEKYAKGINKYLRKAMNKLVKDIEPAEKIGIALSGGLDSTIVSYLLQNIRNHDNISFSLHVEGYEAEERDLDMAINAAAALSLEHKIIVVSPGQVIQSVEPVVKLITQKGHKPHDYNVYSGVVTYLLGPEMKRIGIKKCFGGEGADELSGSYSPSGSFQIPHENMTTIEMRRKLFVNLVEHGYLDRTTKTLGIYGIDAPSPYLDKEFADFMLSIPPEFFNREHWKLPLIKAFEQELPISLRNNLLRPKVRAQVGSGVLNVLQKAGYDQNKLEEILLTN